MEEFGVLEAMAVAASGTFSLASLDSAQLSLRDIFRTISTTLTKTRTYTSRGFESQHEPPTVLARSLTLSSHALKRERDQTRSNALKRTQTR